MFKKYSLAIALSLCALSSVAFAADMPVKAPAASPFQYPTGSGWFVGIGTEGGGGQANVTVPGVNSNSLITNEIGVHGLVGYSSSVKNTSIFWTVEARGGWQNFNGSAPGFSFSGPLAFEQRFTFGAPTDQLIAMLPQVFSSLTPAPFVAPIGQTITWTKGYVGVTVDERDVSVSFGQLANRAWDIAPGLVVGFKNLLSSGTVADVYAKVRFDDKGTCVGNLGGMACGRSGPAFLAGINLDWGI